MYNLNRKIFILSRSYILICAFLKLSCFLFFSRLDLKTLFAQTNDAFTADYSYARVQIKDNLDGNIYIRGNTCNIIFKII